MRNNLVLTGFMGCGKSTVGRLLAERLGFTFCDSDSVIEKRENTSVKDIFAQKGEDYFRKLEADVIREVSLNSGLVIATGGGTVLNPENAKNLRKTGVVFLLEITPETVLKRLENDTSRPLLMRNDKAKSIATLMSERKPLYTAAAHFVVNAENNPENVVEQILELYIKNRSKP